MPEQCPACARPGRKLSLLVESRYRLHRCAGCGTQFFRVESHGATGALHSRDRSEYWQEPGKFDVYGSLAVREGYARRYQTVLDDAERALGPAGSILDVGCGTGNFLQFARGRGMRAVGLDLDENAVRAARRRGLEAYPIEELDTLQGVDHLDALSMWDVVEHLIDPHATLRAVLPRVREGGMLIFETPDGDFPLRHLILRLHAVSRGRWNLSRPMYYWEHKVYFTERGLRALLERLGCEIVSVRRATSVREKMAAVFTTGSRRNARAGRRLLSALWPLLETASRRAGYGNKLLLVARTTPATAAALAR